MRIWRKEVHLLATLPLAAEWGSSSKTFKRGGFGAAPCHIQITSSTIEINKISKLITIKLFKKKSFFDQNFGFSCENCSFFQVIWT